MPLLDQKYAQVAAWVEAAHPKYAKLGTGSLAFPSGTTLDDNKLASIVLKAGLLDDAKAAGGLAQQDVYALQALVSNGQISAAEATAFLIQKYPNQKWSSPKWGAQGSSTVASKAASIAASTTGDATVEQLQEAAQDVHTSVEQGVAYEQVPTPAANVELFVDPLPKAYNQDKAQAVIESLRDQIALAIGELASKLQFGPGSIPGSAIAPGTLPPSAFNPTQLLKYVMRLPGPDEAIIIEIAPSQTMDRWVAGTTSRGPGRVWSVTGVKFPAGFKPKPGPTRYRLVVAGQRFSVMSLRLDPSNDYNSNPTVPFECRYGIVIEGIEHFLGRPPIAVWALSKDDAPVSLASIFDGGGSSGTLIFNTNRLFHARAKATYQDSAFPSFTAFGSGAFLPSASNWQECEGFTFMLVTGETDEEVYQQMNTLDCVGQSISREAHGPGASVPNGLTVSPPAPPSVYTWDGQAGANADFTAQADTVSLVGADRVVQGVPFRYEDCARFVATGSRFSVVIQPSFFKSVAMTGTWTTPEDWGNVGLVTSGSGVRDWAIDLLIW